MCMKTCRHSPLKVGRAVLCAPLPATSRTLHRWRFVRRLISAKRLGATVLSGKLEVIIFEEAVHEDDELAHDGRHGHQRRLSSRAPSEFQLCPSVASLRLCVSAVKYLCGPRNPWLNPKRNLSLVKVIKGKFFPSRCRPPLRPGELTLYRCRNAPKTTPRSLGLFFTLPGSLITLFAS